MILATVPPPTNAATPARMSEASSESKWRRNGSSGISAPIANVTSDAPAATIGRWQFVVVDPEFLAHVHPERGLRAPPDLPRHPVRQVGVDALVPEDRGQFPGLGLRVVLELVLFLGDLGLDEFVLRGHRHVFARGHRERAGREAGEAGQHDRVAVAAAASDAGDQRDVRDQAVHGAEDRWPQPPA